MLILVLSVRHWHDKILRKECSLYFLAMIFHFNSIFNNLCQFVRPRGLKWQNKMDFESFLETEVLNKRTLLNANTF